MSLDLRLSILLENGMISQQNYEKVMLVIHYFEEHQNMILTEENSAMFITHLCSALQRISNHEEIETIDQAVWESAQQEPVFAKAEQIMEDLKPYLHPIPEAEVKFILTHISVMLSS